MTDPKEYLPDLFCLPSPVRPQTPRSVWLNEILEKTSSELAQSLRFYLPYLPPCDYASETSFQMRKVHGQHFGLVLEMLQNATKDYFSDLHYSEGELAAEQRMLYPDGQFGVNSDLLVRVQSGGMRSMCDHVQSRVLDMTLQKAWRLAKADRHLYSEDILQKVEIGLADLLSYQHEKPTWTQRIKETPLASLFR